MKWTLSASPTCRLATVWAFDYENEAISVSRPTTSHACGKPIESNFCTKRGCVVLWRAQKTGEEERRRIPVDLRLPEPELISALPIDHFDDLESFDELGGDRRCIRDMSFGVIALRPALC
jgi:hypothetical protein